MLSWSCRFAAAKKAECKLRNLPKYVFLIAGIYGLVVLTPHYFLEGHFSAKHPPAITHPEFYYGFLGVALAFQVLFIIISRDPVRLRPAMIAAVLEKLSFGMAGIVLFLAGRIVAPMLAAGILDLVFGALFVLAYMRTPAGQVQASAA